MIVQKGTIMSVVVRTLAVDHGWSVNAPNFSDKLKRGMLRYSEAIELGPEVKVILRTIEKPISSTTLKKISKLAPDQQKKVSVLLISREIQTVDEYLAKRPSCEEKSKVPQQIPNEQVAIIMGVACFADATIMHTNDFLKQADTFAQMSKENLTDILKMQDAINGSTRALWNVINELFR